jgi:hypothetical protein
MEIYLVAWQRLAAAGSFSSYAPRPFCISKTVEVILRSLANRSHFMIPSRCCYVRA